MTPAAQPLGIYYEICVPPPPEDRRDWGDYARIRRYALLSVARKVLPEERVSWCHRRLSFGKQGVEILVNKDQQRARYKGFALCSSVWTCPVCSAKISRHRGQELSAALAGSGLTPFMGVFTLQHNRGSDLQTLMDDLSAGTRYLSSGAPGKRFRERFKIVGTVSALEYTYGEANGHHPHKHVMYLSALSPEEIEAGRGDILAYFERYKNFLAGKGYVVNDHTVDLVTGAPEISNYLTKWSLQLETTQGQQKEGHEGHYSPFQLLGLIGEGKTQYVPVFQEYAKVFKGKRQLFYSRGLRDRLGMGDDKTDEELSEGFEELNEEHFAYLVWKQIRALQKHEKRGIFGKVLNVARKGDPRAFWNFLRSLGVEPNDQQVISSEYPWLDRKNFDQTARATTPTNGDAAAAGIVEPGAIAGAGDVDRYELLSLDESNPMGDSEKQERESRVTLGMAMLATMSKTERAWPEPTETDWPAFCRKHFPDRPIPEALPET